MEKLAKEYFDYMNFRAKEENLKHELPLLFYKNGLKLNIKTFFNVHNDGTQLTSDTEKPEIFDKWMKLSKN